MLGTICFDFDGVIHSCTSGWTSHADIPDEPVKNIDKLLKALNTSGWRIVIFSARCEKIEGTIAIWEWLTKNGLSNFIVGVYGKKPPAKIYVVNDRVIKFNGDVYRLWNDIFRV